MLLGQRLKLFITWLCFRSPAPSVLDLGVCDAIVHPTPPTCSDNNIESDHGLVSSHTDIVTDNNTLSDSRALVPVPPLVNEEALAVVPVNQKPKRSDLVQRRTRRPFSVSEVEALVQAVEELGTGRYAVACIGSYLLFGILTFIINLKHEVMWLFCRWRDVKLCSFEDADHRTYVDLKVKSFLFITPW